MMTFDLDGVATHDQSRFWVRLSFFVHLGFLADNRSIRSPFLTDSKTPTIWIWYEILHFTVETFPMPEITSVALLSLLFRRSDTTLQAHEISLSNL